MAKKVIIERQLYKPIRRSILSIFLSIFLIGILSVSAIGVGAVGPTSSTPESSPRAANIRQRLSQELREATERGRPLFRQGNPLATPAGLRQKIASQAGKLNLLKNFVYFGTITSILPSNEAFTLDTKQGIKTVQTDEETKFVKGAFKDGLKATFLSLKAGDRVVVIGRTNSQGLMTAKIVIVLPLKEKIKRQAVYGVVEQKISSDSSTRLVLTHPRTGRKVEVLINSQTRITGKNLTNPTAANIQVGNRITAMGTVDDKGVITAKQVHIIPGLARGLFGTQSTSSSKPATPGSRRVSPTPTSTVAPTAAPTATPTP